MSSNLATLQYLLAGLLLLAGLTDDLRSKKIHNPLVLVCLAIAISFLMFTQGPTGVMNGSLSALAALVAILPLFLMRVVGGGDVKLFVVVCFLLSWQIALISLLASLIWGAILGVIMVFVKGQGHVFIQNMKGLLMRIKPAETNLHKIPYSVALFFGIATAVTLYGGRG